MQPCSVSFVTLISLAEVTAASSRKAYSQLIFFFPVVSSVRLRRRGWIPGFSPAPGSQLYSPVCAGLFAMHFTPLNAPVLGVAALTQRPISGRPGDGGGSTRARL